MQTRPMNCAEEKRCGEGTCSDTQKYKKQKGLEVYTPTT
jgi:hypothetical protein